MWIWLLACSPITWVRFVNLSDLTLTVTYACASGETEPVDCEPGLAPAHAVRGWFGRTGYRLERSFERVPHESVPSGDRLTTVTLTVPPGTALELTRAGIEHADVQRYVPEIRLESADGTLSVHRSGSAVAAAFRPAGERVWEWVFQG